MAILTRSFRFTDADGRPQLYIDRKRALWLLSVVYPLSPVFAVALHAFFGIEWLLALPIAFTYGLVPLLDYLCGEDRSNPPEQTVSELEGDRYYRVLTWLTVPLHLISLIVAAAWAAAQDVSTVGWLTLAVVAGLASGLAVNTAHEMGHKHTRVEQWLSRLALAVPAYGHFTVEHNFGHHKHVATPEDCASARMNESIYRFALREMPGGLLRRKTGCGDYERCQPYHSWNSNHIFSNLMLFHLERHSDHHANPNRRYQSLRHFDELPELPTGYSGMFLLAYVPPLWFRVMNPRLLSLPHVDGVLSRVNR